MSTIEVRAGMEYGVDSTEDDELTKGRIRSTILPRAERILQWPRTGHPVRCCAHLGSPLGTWRLP